MPPPARTTNLGVVCHANPMRGPKLVFGTCTIPFPYLSLDKSVIPSLANRSRKPLPARLGVVAVEDKALGGFPVAAMINTGVLPRGPRYGTKSAWAPFFSKIGSKYSQR